MAIRPDYDIGTVTLVASSANFTTSGSSLQTAAVQAGDAIIAPSGHVLIIASITGQNSGTLFLPCPPDAAGTGLPLRIRFQPDGSRYQGAVRDLIDLLSSGNLEAFASLVGAAGMVPIFTGVGTLDLADPATFGIQDPNGNLGELAGLTDVGNLTDFAGLALAANKWLATDASADLALIDALTGDSIAQQMLASFGMYYNASSGMDLNNAVGGDRGLYAASLANAPSVGGVSNWWIETQRTYSGFSKRQIATSYYSSGAGAPIVAIRVCSNNGEWGPWGYISGSYGSNANGTYVRYPNGLTWCFRSVTPNFNLSSYQSWLTPIAFSEILGQFSALVGNNNDALTVVSGVVNRPTTSNFTIAFRGTVSSSATGSILLTAVGLS